jgi:hypothetical protein
LVEADAENVVLRTIAAESAIFVLLNISYLPAELLRLVVTLAIPDNSAPTSGPNCMTAAAIHRSETAKRQGYSRRSKPTFHSR